MFTLTIEDSNGQIADRFTFDHGAYVIGRQDDCDIVLPSTSVSRQHARIFIDNGRCYVEDLGSSNGIVVDGQRVIKQRDLGTASQLKVGDFYLYIEYKNPDRGAQASVLQTLFISDDDAHAKLVRINDSFAGEEFSLSEVENTIGRTDDNFILLSDGSISRHHARVIRDGEQYTVVDLGSSNGSKLNGKQLKFPTPINYGDRVHFGNVEFVFVRGNMDVNPADYAGSPGSNFVLFAGLAIILIIGIALGAMIIFGWVVSKDDSGADLPVEATLESQVTHLISEAKAAEGRLDWDGAVNAYSNVLALDPSHPDARGLKATAETERDAHKQYERAEVLVEEGRHRDALELFKRVPEGTKARDQAGQQIIHVRKTLAHNLKTEASRLAKSKKGLEVKEAHEKVVESLELNPGDAEALSLVKKVEKTLKKKHKNVKFTPFKGK